MVYIYKIHQEYFSLKFTLFIETILPFIDGHQC